MMWKTIKPRKGQIFRCAFDDKGTEGLGVIVSCNEANDIRNVVVVCEVTEHDEKICRLPTVTHLERAETALDGERDALASPYTLPKGNLVSLEGRVSGQALSRLELAIQRIFGWEMWP